MKNTFLSFMGIALTLVFTSCAGVEKDYQEHQSTPDPIEESVISEIPNSCTSWFDGCNTCFVEDGKIGGCTRKFCPQEAMQEPKCLQYVEEESEKEAGEILTFQIESEYRDCTGVAPMKCLVVNGKNFYDTIHGFDFVEGNSYTITVRKTNAFKEEEILPADVSLFRYDLVEVLEVKGNKPEIQDAPDMADVEIPVNCKSWSDGCNICTVEEGKMGACTERACFRFEEPKCLEYFEE